MGVMVISWCHSDVLMTGMAYARYANPQSAAYARDKLNGFEYPIGTPLKVQLAEEGSVADGYSQQNSDM